jgi:hypothetical protein
MQSDVQQVQQQYLPHQQRKFLVISIGLGVACTIALTWAAGELFQRTDRALKTAVNTPIPQMARSHAIPVQWAGAVGQSERKFVDLGTVVVSAPRDEALAAQAKARREGRLAQASAAAAAGVVGVTP